MSRPPADPEAGPQTRKVKYTCTNSACGAHFTRTTRLGIWSKCPKCGQRVYGPKVHEDLARQKAEDATNGSDPNKGGRSAPASRAPAQRESGDAAAARQPERTKVGAAAQSKPSTPTPPAPNPQPASPAAPAPSRSLWSQLMGSEDD